MTDAATSPPQCDLCERRTSTLTELYYGGRVLRVCAECRKRLMKR